MRRKVGLFLLVWMLGLASCVTEVWGEPKDWPKPWGKDVELKINWNDPYDRGDHATLQGLKNGYAVDFMPHDGDSKIEIFSPVNGTIVCCNFPEYKGELLGKGTCENGHPKKGGSFGDAYGYHLIIKPDEDNGDTSSVPVVGYSKNSFIIAHLSSEEHPPLASFDKTGDGNYKVKRGDKLGLMGDTGKGPKHLHFELINRSRSTQNEADCDSVQLFGITRAQFESEDPVWLSGSFPEGGTTPNPTPITLGGTYNGVRGVYGSETSQTSTPWVNGGLYIVETDNGDEKDSLYIKTTGTNGRINFHSGAWLNLGGSDRTYPKKNIGQASGRQLREWETQSPHHIHYFDGSGAERVDATYKLTQIDANTLRLTVTHKYANIEVTLVKSDSNTASASVAGALDASEHDDVSCGSGSSGTR